MAGPHRADAAAVDAAIGAWLHAQAAARDRADPGNAAGQGADETTLVAIAVDGKTVRGAINADGAQIHLLAAATHGEQLVLGQVEVGVKSNEIPQFAPLISGLAAAGVDLSQAVFTADALHTQRAHAEYLHSIGAQFVLTAKHNQPRLFAALDALAWADNPIAHREVQHGHARVTTRTIQVLPAPADLPFPHVNQVWLIERYVCDHAGTLVSCVAALGVTSLTAQRADPPRIAALVREHWGIESLHRLRDTVYREDNSTARTGSGPRVMAALRNFAIGAIHLLGRRDITETTRWATRVMDRPFKICSSHHDQRSWNGRARASHGKISGDGRVVVSAGFLWASYGSCLPTESYIPRGPASTGAASSSTCASCGRAAWSRR